MNRASNRPVIAVPLSPTDTVVEAASLVALVASLLIVAYYWPKLPETIPTHSGFSGRIDGWGPKSTMLMLPAVALVTYVGFALICRFPHKFSYPVRITQENAAGQYAIALSAMRWLKLEILLLWCTLEWQLALAAVRNLRAINPLPQYLLFAAVFITLAVLIAKQYTVTNSH